jgi:hypothetical protein
VAEADGGRSVRAYVLRMLKPKVTPLTTLPTAHPAGGRVVAGAARGLRA